MSGAYPQWSVEKTHRIIRDPQFSAIEGVRPYDKVSFLSTYRSRVLIMISRMSER